MEVDKGTKSKGFSKGGVEVKKECAECIGCSELQAEIKRKNDRCAYLEIDIGKKNCVLEWLECKLSLVESERRKIEDEGRVLKKRNEELGKGFRNIKEEHDVFSQLMVENSVLKCEKKKAESEVEIWKVKCQDLEIKVVELEKRMCSRMIQSDPHVLVMHSEKISRVGETENKANEDKDLLGTPPICSPFKANSRLLKMHSEKTSQVNSAGGLSSLLTEAENNVNDDTDVLGSPPCNPPFKPYSEAEGFNSSLLCERSTARKCLDFSAEENPYKNVSPSTPPFAPIDISDSDDDLNTSHKHLADLHCKVRNKVRSSCTGLWVTLDEKKSTLKDRYEAAVKHERSEADATCNTGGEPYLRLPKRRNVRGGVAYEVSSDSESNSTEIYRVNNSSVRMKGK